MGSSGKDFFTGFGSTIRGLKYIHREKLFLFLIIPGAISVVTVMAMGSFVYVGITGIILELTGRIQPGFWQNALLYAGQFLGIIAGFFISVFLYRSVVMVVVIPFLGPLLGRIEKKLLGYEKAIGWKEELKNLGFAVWMSFYFLIMEIFVLVISLFLGPLGPILLFSMESYLMGRGAFDYLMEKDYPVLSERKKITAQKRALIWGAGVSSFLLMFIPVYGWIMAPAASLVGLTLNYYEKSH